MKSKVIKLYDYHLSKIPEELTKWRISEEEINEQLNLMAEKYKDFMPVNEVQLGDGVLCTCIENTSLNGRKTVYLYPGQNLLDIDSILLNKKLNEIFELTIHDTNLKLKIEKIYRKSSITIINDDLIKNENIEGIETVEEYKEWYRKKGEESIDNKLWQIHAFWCREVGDKSELAIDQEEMDAYVKKNARRMYDDLIEQGINPCISEDGLTILSEQEAIEQHYPIQEQIYRLEVTGKALNESFGIYYSKEDAEKKIKSILKEHNLTLERYLELMQMSYEQVLDYLISEMANEELEKIMKEEAKKYLEK